MVVSGRRRPRAENFPTRVESRKARVAGSALASPIVQHATHGREETRPAVGPERALKRGSGSGHPVHAALPVHAGLRLSRRLPSFIARNATTVSRSPISRRRAETTSAGSMDQRPFHFLAGMRPALIIRRTVFSERAPGGIMGTISRIPTRFSKPGVGLAAAEGFSSVVKDNEEIAPATHPSAHDSCRKCNSLPINARIPRRFRCRTPPHLGRAGGPPTRIPRARARYQNVDADRASLALDLHPELRA